MNWFSGCLTITYVTGRLQHVHDVSLAKASEVVNNWPGDASEISSFMYYPYPTSLHKE